MGPRTERIGLPCHNGSGLRIIAQAIAGRATTGWLWLIASGAYFLGALFTSEVWFGWATEKELQPNFDGLSYDEALLFGLLFGIASIVVTWFVTRRSRRHRARPA